MLITKKIKQNDIVSVKMISGEEVLAKIVSYSETTDNFVVSKPLILAQNPGGNIAAIPFVVTADCDQVEFSKSHVIALPPTSKSFSDQYIKITTGILPVKDSGLVL